MEPNPIAGGFRTQIIPRSRPKKGIPAWYQASVAILEGHAAGMEYPIKKTYAVIGRSRNAAVSLKDPLASRQHAAIMFHEDAFILKDLDSTNGTYMRGAYIRQRKLSHGDKFRIGKTVLQFILQDRGGERTYDIK
jgi:pSer/pThr/pTyr-binding forkhead associated (FHA) protein